MACRIGELVLGCRDPEVLARFWCDEPEKGKSRLHIDVNATDRDQDAELERLLKLGARPARLNPL